MKEPKIKVVNTMKQKVNTLEVHEKSAFIKKAETLPNPKTIEVQEIVDKWSQYRYHGTLKRRSFFLSFIYNDYLYAIGGTDISEGKLNDINRLKLSTAETGLSKWELIKPTLAMDKIAYAAGVLCEGGDYYIIGGQNQALMSMQRIIKYAANTNGLEYILIENSAIPPIDSHTACLLDKTIYIFGGNSNDKRLNDVYSYNIGDSTTANLTEGNEVKPPHRNQHSAIIAGNIMYIHGGMNNKEEYLDDLWRYAIAENKWSQIELIKDNSPTGRIGHTLTLIDNKVYLFGGMTKIIRETNELWLFDPNAEANGFVMIHDNIIEVEETVNEEELDEYGESARNKKKKFRLLSHSEVEKRTNPNFYTQYDKSKPNNTTQTQTVKQSKSNIGNSSTNANFEQFERTLHMNAEMKKKANVTKMKNSNIFTINKQEANLINEKLKEVDKANIPDDMLYFKGFPPIPRNGQCALAFGNKLFIFGGDRNKMAFNDISCFDTSLPL